MKADFPTRRAIPFLIFFLFTVSAGAFTLDLGKTGETEPVSVEISATDTNRIEFPETVINAFSSKEALDVKIVGRSVLLRTREPAELIILTEKRRVTLLLVPGELPSRTIIVKTDDPKPHDSPGEKASKLLPSSYEKTLIDLTASLASQENPPDKVSGERFSGSLFLSSGATEEYGGFSASEYVLENRGKKTVRVSENMFFKNPETVAVGIEKIELSPGETCRIFIVTGEDAEP